MRKNIQGEQIIFEKSIQKTSDLGDKAAQALSFFTAAPLVSIPVFVFINYEMANTSFLFLSAISVLFAGILPFSFILFWNLKVKKTSVDILDKNDRPILLIFVIISYFIGTIVLYILHAPWLVSGMMFCYFTTTLFILIVNFFWKISIYAMGIAAPMTALFFINVLSGLLFGGLLLCVMWSRVHLHRHTLAQVLAGRITWLPLHFAAVDCNYVNPVIHIFCIRENTIFGVKSASGKNIW